jgi:hypothetical protein
MIYDDGLLIQKSKKCFPIVKIPLSVQRFPSKNRVKKSLINNKLKKLFGWKQKNM